MIYSRSADFISIISARSILDAHTAHTLLHTIIYFEKLATRQFWSNSFGAWYSTVLRNKQNLYHVIIIVKGFIIMGNPLFFFYKIEPIFANFTQIERWWGFNWQLIEEMWS